MRHLSVQLVAPLLCWRAVACGPGSAAAPIAVGAAGGAAAMALEEGKGEVSSFVNIKTGVKMDIGEGFSAEIPAGNRFRSVLT